MVWSLTRAFAVHKSSGRVLSFKTLFDLAYPAQIVEEPAIDTTSSCNSSTLAPRRRAAATAHSRRSFGLFTNSNMLSSVQVRSSQTRSEAPVPSDRTALCKAPGMTGR